MDGTALVELVAVQNLLDGYDWRDIEGRPESNSRPTRIIEQIYKRDPDSVYLPPNFPSDDRSFLRNIVGIHNYNIGVYYNQIGVNYNYTDTIILRKSATLFALFPHININTQLGCRLNYYKNDGSVGFKDVSISFMEEDYSNESLQIYIPDIKDMHFDSTVWITNLTPHIPTLVNSINPLHLNCSLNFNRPPRWVSYPDLVHELRVAEEIFSRKTFPRLMAQKPRGLYENNPEYLKLEEIIKDGCSGLNIDETSTQFDPRIQIANRSANKTLVFPTHSFIAALFLLNPAGAVQLETALKREDSVVLTLPALSPGGKVDNYNICLHRGYELGKIHHNIPNFPQPGLLLYTQFS